MWTRLYRNAGTSLAFSLVIAGACLGYGLYMGDSLDTLAGAILFSPHGPLVIGLLYLSCVVAACSLCVLAGAFLGDCVERLLLPDHPRRKGRKPGSKAEAAWPPPPSMDRQ